MAIIRTYLELDDPAALRPAAEPRLPDIDVTRIVPPDGEISRWFYLAVGGPYDWNDSMDWSPHEWQSWADGVETWVATVGRDRAGYYELRRDGESVQVSYLGLLAAFQGHGLGGHLLTHALRRGLALAPRVWLHTSTQDGEAALPNYRARGLRPFREEVVG